MNENWLEYIDECFENDMVKCKATFEIYSNFSYLQNIITELLKEKKSIAIKDLKNEKLEYDVKDALIQKNINLSKISLLENNHEFGYFEIEIEYGVFTARENFKEEYSPILNKTSKLILDYFKYSLTLMGHFIIVIPNSLWVYINFRDNWEKVIQIGKIEMPKIDCDKKQTTAFIEHLPKLINDLDKCILDKKYKKIIESLNTALRLEQYKLYRDAYLNFYNITETIFRDKEFRQELVQTIKKPKEYGDALGNCNQKLIMLFLWEFLVIAHENIFRNVEVKDFIELSDIRNKLSHDSDLDINQKNLNLIKLITNVILREYSKLVIKK